MSDSTSDELVELYRACGLPEAQALYFRLEEAGISARIDNEMLQGVVGEVPAGWMTAPRVLVLQRDLEAARRVLQEFLPVDKPPVTRQVSDALSCLACGATMTASNTCPNCNWTYATDPGSPSPPRPSDAPTAQASDAVPEPAQPQGSTPPPLAGRAVWLEVAAVLAVGVVPPLLGAIASLAETPTPSPYWSNCVSLTGTSACTAFVVLYLIHRSGEPWKRFGLVGASGWDLPLGLGMLIVAELVLLVYARLGLAAEKASYTFPVPRGTAEYAMMVIQLGANAFAEELVTRAYLITRLEVLLRFCAKAVVLAAAAFASYHIYQGTPATLFIFMLGASYGAAYLGVRRIWPFAIGHTLFGIHAELSY